VPSSKPSPPTAGKKFEVEPFAVQAQQHRRTVMVRMRGELDLATISTLTAVLDGLNPQADGVRHVVLDLRGLTFMGSDGVQMLLQQGAFARTNGHNLAVVQGNDAIQRLLTLTKAEARLVLVEAPEDLIPPDQAWADTADD
jgi:anti-anti-sigma factor